MYCASTSKIRRRIFSAQGHMPLRLATRWAIPGLCDIRRLCNELTADNKKNLFREVSIPLVQVENMRLFSPV